MNHRFPLLAPALLALLPGSVMPALAQYTYHALPPTPDLPNDSTVSTWTSGINNLGQVAGYEIDPTGNHFVVVWTNDVPVKLPLPDGDKFVFGNIEINDSGQVLTNLSSGTTGVPVLWTNGVPAVVPPGPNPCVPASASSMAIDLNNLGHVLGLTKAGTCVTYWIWNGQQFHVVQPPLLPGCAATTFSAVAVNNHDDVLGILPAPTCPVTGQLLPIVIHADGTFHFYAVPTGFTATAVQSINDAGQANGTANDSHGVGVALLWSSPTAAAEVIRSPKIRQFQPVPGKLNREGDFILTTGNDAGAHPYLFHSGSLTALDQQGLIYPNSGGPVNNTFGFAITGEVEGNYQWPRGLRGQFY